MMTDELWAEIKELPAEAMWNLIKDISRDAKEKEQRGEYRDFLCILLKVLDITRRIQKLEAERELVNRLLGEGE